MLHNNKIVCLAVDDEPPALQVIEKYIAATPVLQLAATCNNAVDALSILQQQKVKGHRKLNGTRKFVFIILFLANCGKKRFALLFLHEKSQPVHVLLFESCPHHERP